MKKRLDIFLIRTYFTSQLNIIGRQRLVFWSALEYVLAIPVVEFLWLPLLIILSQQGGNITIPTAQISHNCMKWRRILHRLKENGENLHV